MKTYDREKKAWVEEKEAQGSLAKRKMCKGGKEHDWMLCLPDYVKVEGSVLGLDKVEEYYKTWSPTQLRLYSLLETKALKR